MPSCVVQGCTSGGKHRDSNIILHVFPKDKQVIRNWLLQTGQDFGDLDKFVDLIYEKKKDDTYRMCSLHFTEMNYRQNQGIRKSLRKDALPTVFASTSAEVRHLPTAEKHLAKRRRVDNPLTSDNSTKQSVCSHCGQLINVQKERVTVGLNTEWFFSKQSKCSQTDPKYFSRSKGFQFRTETRNKKIQCTKLRGKKKKSLKKKSKKTMPERENVQLTDQSAEMVLEIDPEMFSNTYQVSSGSSSPSTKYDSDSTFHVSQLDDSSISSEEDTVIEKEDCYAHEEILEHVNLSQNLTIHQKMIYEHKFLVFESCLDELIMKIPCQADGNCGYPILEIFKKRMGTYVSVYVRCQKKHYYKLWESQPKINGKPVGNLIVSAGVLCSGSTYTKINQFFYLTGILFIDKSTFCSNKVDYLYPTIDYFWKEDQKINLAMIGSNSMCLSGDGQRDTPGHSAKYCVYSLMDLDTSKILSLHIDQVKAHVSSVALEKMACKSALQHLLEKNLSVKIICTDRHVGIRKMLKDNFPGIIHQYDVWHVAKSIGRKLNMASRKKECSDILPWLPAIKTHLWWSASTCEGDPELLLAKWNSLLYHIVNIHEWHDPTSSYNACQHDKLDTYAEEKRKWLQKGSTVYNNVKDVVQNKQLLEDLRQLSEFCHSGNFEFFHSAILKYRPKRQHFSMDGMTARTQLAALDHNYNCLKVKSYVKQQCSTLERYGAPRYGLAYFKARKHWLARAMYEPSQQDFLKIVLSEVLECAAGTRQYDWSSSNGSVPQNIARVKKSRV